MGSKQDIIEKPKVYAPPSDIPCLEAVDGIRYDFNCGCRVFVPSDAPRQEYQVILKDADTDVLLFNMLINPHDVQDGARGKSVHSSAKYYLRFQIIIVDPKTNAQLFEHTMSLEDNPVLVQMPMGALGDTIGWMSYIEAFQKKYRPSQLSVSMKPIHQAMFKEQYPDIDFCDMEGAAERIKTTYATYHLGLFWGCNMDWQPMDFHQVGLHKIAAYILGVEEATALDIPPRVSIGERTIHERYVCIGTQASAQEKYWNNPGGWMEIVRWLKSFGYRVICIDQRPYYGRGNHWNYIPFGCEDFTGDRPLQERIDMLAYADFFIGLSSGLSWLAWAAGTPVVMITGFTNPVTEFRTPYRVQNTHVCHGCWDDQRLSFDHSDFFWCPRKKKEEEKFECTRCITPKMVKEAIERIPAFKDFTHAH